MSCDTTAYLFRELIEAMGFGEENIMKQSAIIFLVVVALGLLGMGYLSTVQIPAPEKTVSKVIPNEQLPR